MSVVKHSIEPILRHYGATMPYSRNGWVKMKCCFHDDSHASAAVNIEENAFKCFACDVKGDVYDIIMDQEGLDFVKAVKFAEEFSPESGATIRSRNTAGSGVSRKQGANLGRRSTFLARGRD